MADSAPVRRAEIVGALSLATDLGMGLPLETGLRAAVLSAGLAREVEPETAADAYALALLRFIGCTADASAVNSLFGDEIAFNAEAVAAMYDDPVRVMRFMLARAGSGHGPATRAATIARLATSAQSRMERSAAAHCEVAMMLAPRLSYGDRLARLLRHGYDRYDGRAGRQAGGDQIPLAARIVHVGFDAAACQAAAGTPAAAAMLRSRAGKGYDPEVVDVFCERAQALCEPLAAPDLWEVAMAAEPGPRPVLSGDRLDEALTAMADFTDLKSAYTIGHSRAVSALAASAGRVLGLPEDTVAAVRRAGLVHDLGRVTVPVTVWDSAAPLGADQRERIRLHPYYTERILSPAGPLRPLGVLASFHHERVDGGGYHRGCRAAEIPEAARVLAAADAYRTMLEPRPHRPTATVREAVRRLRLDATAGRLDGAAVQAVLEASGHATGTRRRHAAGLTAREVQVLGRLSRGLTTRQIARDLGISAKTADHHIQHIYAKTGVTTRAAATLFAIQHDLVSGSAGS